MEEAPQARPPKPQLHYVRCQRCGHDRVERRRLQRHYNSKGCRRAVEKHALERQTSVEEEVAAAGPPPPASNYNPQLKRVRCPRCGDDDVGVGRLSAHYRTKRCRVASGEAGYDPEAEADENAHDNGAPEPRYAERMHAFLSAKSGLKPVTVRTVMRWVRRLARFSGRDEDLFDGGDVARLACDRALADRFVHSLRDDERLGVPSLLRAVDAMRWLLDYSVVELAPDDREAAAQDRNLKLLKRRLRSDELAQENGGAYGKTVEQLEERGEWATTDELLGAMKRGRLQFLEASKALLDEGRAPTSAEARRLGAFLFFAVVFGGTPVRTGTLEGLTPNEVRELVREGSVTTSKFKTSKTHGAVTIQAPEWLGRLLAVYHSAVHRPLAAGRPQKHFFIVAHGKPMDKSGRDVGALLKGLCGKYVTVTRVRQILETHSKQRLSRDEQEAVSGAMTHSSRVAAKFYQKVRAKDRARRAREALAGSLGVDEVMGVDDEED